MRQAETLEDSALEAKAKSHLYGFFSLVYQKEPTEELLSELEQPDLRALVQEWGLDLSWLRDNKRQLLKELAIEYARLFLVPGKERVPLFESVYSEQPQGTLWGHETVDVKRFFEEIGLKLERTGLLPDHLAVEFEVLQKLALKEAAAYAQLEEPKAREYRQAQLYFLQKHLGRWFPRFAEGVERSASRPFYRQITTLAKLFLDNELADLGQRLT